MSHLSTPAVITGNQRGKDTEMTCTGCGKRVRYMEVARDALGRAWHHLCLETHERRLDDDEDYYRDVMCDEGYNYWTHLVA